MHFNFNKENKRYYYKAATGEFHDTTSDNAMFDCLTDPYIVREEGWDKHNYRIVEGELTYLPIELENSNPRG